MDEELIMAMFTGDLYKYLLENSVYPDEEFKKSEAEAIKRLSVPPKDNIFDYYEDEEKEVEYENK